MNTEQEQRQRDELEDIVITTAVLAGLSGLLIGISLMSLIWWLN